MEVVAKESKNAGLVKPVNNDFKNNLAAMLAKGRPNSKKPQEIS